MFKVAFLVTLWKKALPTAVTEAYLGPCQISIMELFYENS